MRLETEEGEEGEEPYVAVDSSRYIKSVKKLFGPAIAMALIAARVPLEDLP